MVSAILYERRRETIERAHDFNEALELHRRIYRAIRARKPEEAREAMREHIIRAQRAFALEEATAQAIRLTDRSRVHCSPRRAGCLNVIRKRRP